MSPVGIVAFDIIGTCFSLDKPRQKLIDLGAPPYTLELWFAQALRDAFAFSHAGSYHPLKDFLTAELPRTLKQLKVSVDQEQVSQVIATFAELELQSGAKEALKTLTDADVQVVALTNGSEESTQQLLERSQVDQYFEQIFSCDGIQKTKPAQDVYKMINNNSQTEIWLVAAHAWDIAGAAKAGLKTAFVTYLETDYLKIYPQPDITTDSLVAAANQILQDTISKN